MICQRSQLEPCHSRLQLGLVGGGFHQSNHRADRDRQESIVLQGEDEQLVEGVRALPSSKPGLHSSTTQSPHHHHHRPPEAHSVTESPFFVFGVFTVFVFGIFFSKKI